MQAERLSMRCCVVRATCLKFPGTSPARMYDYYLGGKDDFPVGRSTTP